MLGGSLVYSRKMEVILAWRHDDLGVLSLSR